MYAIQHIPTKGFYYEGEITELVYPTHESPFLVWFNKNDADYLLADLDSIIETESSSYPKNEFQVVKL